MNRDGEPVGHCEAEKILIVCSVEELEEAQSKIPENEIDHSALTTEFILEEFFFAVFFIRGVLTPTGHRLTTRASR